MGGKCEMINSGSSSCGSGLYDLNRDWLDSPRNQFMSMGSIMYNESKKNNKKKKSSNCSKSNPTKSIKSSKTGRRSPIN